MREARGGSLYEPRRPEFQMMQVEAKELDAELALRADHRGPATGIEYICVPGVEGLRDAGVLSGVRAKVRPRGLGPTRLEGSRGAYTLCRAHLLHAPQLLVVAAVFHEGLEEGLDWHAELALDDRSKAEVEITAIARPDRGALLGRGAEAGRG